MLKHLWQTALTDAKKRDLEGIGRLRYEDDGAVYRWVLNKEAAATDFTAGQVVFHKLSDAGSMLKWVYQCLTANLGVMAGVVMPATLYGGAADTDSNTYAGFGWIQTQGNNTSVSVSGATTGGTAIAAGDYLKGVNSANHVVRDAATQALYKRNIQALAAVATTTTPAAAFVRCLINCN